MCTTGHTNLHESSRQWLAEQMIRVSTELRQGHTKSVVVLTASVRAMTIVLQDTSVGTSTDLDRVSQEVLQNVRATREHVRSEIADETAQILIHKENAEKQAHLVRTRRNQRRKQSKRKNRQPPAPTPYTDLTCCPLSHKRPVQPVILADGYTYERHLAVLHLQQSDISPVTGHKLVHTLVTPNFIMLQL